MNLESAVPFCVFHAFSWHKKSRQRPTLPPRYQGSTIGAGGLNFCVRNGNRCGPSAITTGKTNDRLNAVSRLESCRKRRVCISAKCGQAARPISTGKLHGVNPAASSLASAASPASAAGSRITALTPPAYQPRSLRGVFTGPLRVGISHLGVSFPLRCFQRLSHPNIATQLCRWRDNWYTIGSSI